MEKITIKRFYGKIALTLIFTLVVIVLNTPFSLALKDSSEELCDIYIDFHSVAMIREGYSFPASVTIRNLNESETLSIKKVTILNYGVNE